MTKGRFHKCIAWLLVLVFVCSTVFVSAGTAEAANVGKKIKSIAVRAGGKKVTKKTVTLRRGAKTTLKVSVSPREAKKHIKYKSSKESVVAVSKKGRVTAEKAGTAKITVTVSGNGYKKKTTWVNIQVVNSYDTTSNETNVDTPEPNVSTQAPDTPEPNIPTPEPNTPEPNVSVPTPDIQPPVTDNGKSLVVYFSRTGNTKSVAEEIQSLTGSDLVELKTVIPYPASYDDCLAQAQEERANNARP